MKKIAIITLVTFLFSFCIFPFFKTEPTYAAGKKEPGMAVLFSILIAGGGHFYNGNIGTGGAYISTAQ